VSPLRFHGNRALLVLRFDAAKRSVLLPQLPHRLRSGPMGSPVILSHRGKTPVLATDACVAPTATLISHIEVGAQASVWFGAGVGEGCLVGAGAVVSEGMQVPPGTLVAGIPAMAKKELTGSSLDWINGAAAHCQSLALEYMEEG
jgi:carbonic anhydrase/acetyltransferase-like protein (isoleucine patch superfamily)